MMLRVFGMMGILLALCSCGGGGGGGAPQSQGVRVLHAAMAAPPASLTSSSRPGELLQKAFFADSTPYIQLPKGEQTLQLSLPHGEGEFSLPVSVQGSERRSVLLYQNSGTPTFSVALLDEPEAIDLGAGQASVRIIHGIGAAGLISIAVNGELLTSSLEQSQGTPPHLVQAGPLTVAASNDSGQLIAVNLVLSPGSANTLFLAGEANYFLTSRLLTE